MHPVEDLDAPMTGQIAIRQRSSTTIEQTGPSRLPRLGHSARVRHGVWIVPMK